MNLTITSLGIAWTVVSIVSLVVFAGVCFCLYWLVQNWRDWYMSVLTALGELLILAVIILVTSLIIWSFLTVSGVI